MCKAPGRALVTALCLVASLALLASTGRAQAVHLEQAWLSEVAGGDLQEKPPATLPEALRWAALSPVALPFLAPREVSASTQGTTATQTLTRWFKFVLPAQDASMYNYFYLPRWQCQCRVSVYADSQLVMHAEGHHVWNGFNFPLWISLNQGQHAQAPAAIWIRIVSLRHSGAGVSSAWVGPHEALQWRYNTRYFLQVEIPYIASSACLFIGSFVFVSWLLRRRELLLLHFSLHCLFMFLRCMHYYVGPKPLAIDPEWFGWLTVNALLWLLVNLYLFSVHFLQLRNRWQAKPVLALTAMLAIVTAPGAGAVPSVSLLAPFLYLCAAAMVIFIIAFSLWHAWKQPSKETLGFAAFNVMGIPIYAHDLLLQHYKITPESIYLHGYSTIAIFAALGILAFQRYNAALRMAENLNRDLESRLTAREAQLEVTYQKLRLIENEQVLSTERQRLMQDMHDGLGSSLTSALRALDGGHSQTMELRQMLSECIDDLKLTIDSLEPVQTDLLLLLASVRYRLGQRLQAAGIEVLWLVQDVPSLPWLDPKSALHILRIFQEVLSNISKYAQAKQVVFQTRYTDTQVIVSIADNGLGFAMPVHDNPALSDVQTIRGRGLRNMRQRADALGARVRWERAAVGSCFELHLPRERPAGALAAVDPPAP